MQATKVHVIQSSILFNFALDKISSLANSSRVTYFTSRIFCSGQRDISTVPVIKWRL